MSKTTTSDAEIRRRISDLVELHDTATVDEIVTGVSRDLGVADAAVVDELDQMERHGFAYLISTTSGDTEVRLP